MSSIYIGKPWNTDMPTLAHGWRDCPHCKREVYLERIMVYEDGDQWTCPACRAGVTTKSDNGRFGSSTHVTKVTVPDVTKELSDFKRTNPRRYKRRSEQ